MSDQITGYSVAGVIEADPSNEFVWVKFVDCQAAVAAARAEERQHINSMLVVDYVREQYERGAADKAAELQDYYGEQAQGHYNDGYNKAWSLSAAEIERQVREEEQVAQTLAQAESFAAGVKAARETVTAAYAGHWDEEHQEIYRDADPNIGLRAIDGLEKP